MSFASVLGDLVAGGGITGLISSGVGAFAKYKEHKLTFAHERERWKYEIGMQKLQMQSDELLAEKELLIAKQQGADASFTAAIQAEGAIRNTSQWVADLRGAFRPMLTTGLWLMVGGLMIFMPENPNQLMMTIAQGTTNAAAIATGFWFGSRAIKTMVD